ncbi:thiolase [Burkholderia cepacia]|uniref:thiolase C-terminal domain-containing protein n=1 Tax=Burkholderia cepacia TaxID=292 RepID=UPI00075FB1A6|nr:thiolase [Burkholderia cepacia]KWE18345.1 thiolase [Burkholderia cepacia]
MTRTAKVAVVGAAESTELGLLPHIAQIQLHADAALNALADAGLALSDVDGVASTGDSPEIVADYLGIRPAWVDGTLVGGCSPLLQMRHAAAAIEAGLCSTVLITHGQSGRSLIGRTRPSHRSDSLNGQFEEPYGTAGPPSLLPIPIVRFMKTWGLTLEQLASVVVVQREWAARNPRAMLRDPITVGEVLAARPVAWPLTVPQCCLVTDGGGALVLIRAERARDFPQPPVYVLGCGEGFESPLISQMEDMTSSRAFRTAGASAFREAGITLADVDHLMAYDAFAHLPLFALADLGFVHPGEVGAFVADGHTAVGGRLPVNTNGGGLCYTHTGMYGMFALQESVRQLRGIAPAQVPDVRVSVTHGIGGMFSAAGTVVFGREQSTS